HGSGQRALNIAILHASLRGTTAAGVRVTEAQGVVGPVLARDPRPRRPQLCLRRDPGKRRAGGGFRRSSRYIAQRPPVQASPNALGPIRAAYQSDPRYAAFLRAASALSRAASLDLVV